MADLFKALKPHAKLSKNGFDLSRKHVCSSAAGQVNPYLFVETVPGDHIEIDMAALTRTQTMVTAAFVRGTMRFDYFFVPYSQLWHPYNQFVSQRTDKHSTLQKAHTYCPVVSLEALIKFIADCLDDGTYVDVEGFDVGYGAIRLLDLAGYGDFRWILYCYGDSDKLDANKANYRGKYVNLFRLLAVNHIWYDYYRNKYYDTDDAYSYSVQGNEYVGDYVETFNVDDIQCDTFGNAVITPDFTNTASRRRWCKILGQKYIQWKKDLFTSALPSQQFGAVSGVSLSNISINAAATLLASTGDSFGRYHEYAGASIPLAGEPVQGANSGNLRVKMNDNNVHSVVHDHSVSGTATVSGSATAPNAFDVLQLRKAEMLQVWKQNTLRAGNMTDASFEAHFGTTPYYEGDENVNYLGSFSSKLDINTVEATANSSGVNGEVGNIASNGISSTNGSKIRFDARDFGVIVCMGSFLPESEYSSACIDRANQLYEQFDFYTPEFQNIGLEAVTRANLDLSQGPGNSIIGYAPRYWMYKTAVDKVFGEFKAISTNVGQSENIDVPGTLTPWVLPRKDYFDRVGSKRYLRSWYVDPRVFNAVMGISYANGNQTEDYFVHNIFFDIKAIRPMSVLGLPEF